MDEETRKRMFEEIYNCPHCKKRMNDWFRGAFRGTYYNRKLKSLRSRCFCTEECYEDYKKDFVVEIYNDKPIYCVEIDGEKIYMPYFEAAYCFNNIDDCKKEMDMKGVAVVDPRMLFV